jgi:hypothetical protein
MFAAGKKKKLPKFRYLLEEKICYCRVAFCCLSGFFWEVSFLFLPIENIMFCVTFFKIKSCLTAIKKNFLGEGVVTFMSVGYSLKSSLK